MTTSAGAFLGVRQTSIFIPDSFTGILEINARPYAHVILEVY